MANTTSSELKALAASAGVTPPTPEAPTSQNQSNSTTTVVMACKTAHGIIMELGVKDEEGYRAFTLNGANTSRVYGGYGLTGGIPKDFALAWLEKYRRLPMVMKGIVYIEGDEASAIAHAKDNRDVKNGLEPWSPTAAAAAKGSKLELDPDYRKQVATNVDRARTVEML